MGQSTRLNIAIMDRNPHVRELMCRELSALGHAARAVQSEAEALRLLDGPEVPQVLVLDPEALGGGLMELAARLTLLSGRVTAVLHVYPEDQAETAGAQAGGVQIGVQGHPELPGAVVVEKQAHLGPLKALVGSLAQGGVPGVCIRERGA